MRKYTKADLEVLVGLQLENLDAMHDLINIMKTQNELLDKANKKLKEELSDFKNKNIQYPTRRHKK